MGDRTLMNFPALDEMHIWGTNLFRGFMFYWCYLYLFTYTGVQHDFNIRWAHEFIPGF